ncbi:hypothetical protein LshimejAT787_0405690 [Lyophyllum shimeji]|uniref:Essential protein Yae1 N-terminal domain-containing protein n=1 Tax=Lyophyllum shimeji TaxID=47721 RepID=A0A9P3PLA5_LYOSH|nr:hypothetical protein LshimejAT787_0405690 [Lyophyllum shimeji]
MPVPDVDTQWIGEIPKIRSPGQDLVVQLREAATAPSPLAQFVEDPAVIKLSRQKHKSGTKGSRNTPSLKQLALIEEERKVSRLKALLRSAADHLEHEIRRADEAELRAHLAEIQEREVSAKAVAAESSKSRAEVEHERSVAESRRYQIESESAVRELQRLKADLRKVENMRDEFEAASMKAEELNRQYRKTLLKYQIREEDIQQGHRVDMARCFDEGREEGWTAGNEEGFEEGRAIGYKEGRETGRKEGLHEGREQGRIEERRKALEAFERFLSEEMGSYDDGRSARIRKWAESIYHSAQH